ncbi:hypothetical protein C8Q77DRAFT_1253414 [Trametes polyzona]|nr:hypothetical protein C8Q77DRAFT_1253414 [Trametes polyzona]
MSTPKPKFCQGCRKPFTVSGYRSHLKQTRKPACIAAFEGDYFGVYSGDDFEDFDEALTDSLDSGETEDERRERERERLEEEDDDERGASDLEAETGWEPPPRAGPPADSQHAGHGPNTDNDTVEQGVHEGAAPRRLHAHDHLHTRTFPIQFPSMLAGAPIDRPRERSAYETYQKYIDEANVNPYAPFTSRLDWEVARWAKMRGPGSTAVSELLQIEGLASLLGLSYKDSRELNNIIDDHLSSSRPRFVRREVVVAGQAYEIFYRDVLACIQALYGDPEFAGLLVFAPEKHYSNADHTMRVYFDLHTGKWWWETQKEIEKRLPGATIVPVMISSDKTQLTVFGSKTAYPVYMTIGNLPKDIRRKPSRRGQILLAYLPASRLEHITNGAARRRTLANLYHACMGHVLAPLKAAGTDGIELTSGDGATRRSHPIFAMHIGDYPEQLLVACCSNGTCPKCCVMRNDVGQDTDPNRPLRDLQEVLDALDTLDDGPVVFSRACREAGIKPIAAPFWKDLPYVDIFTSITPDILHQLYQGMVKHLLSWLKSSYGPEELDARCRRLPPNHQVRLFLRGVTSLQKVTGKEHGDICRILLGLIIGLPLIGGISPSRLVRAVRALLDFLYLAQYPAHTSETLALMEDALRRFHDNKAIFVQLGVREHFRLPKLHSLDHYITSIKLFGTTDNYDTQYTERLHIDFAKDAYRATNRKDEFPQMTVWLERREKILRHEAYVNWRLRRSPCQDVMEPQLAALVVRPIPHTVMSSPRAAGEAPHALATAWTPIRLTKWPSVKALSFNAAAERYGARYLRDALARFIVQYRNPMFSFAEIEQESLDIDFPFRQFSVFHKLKFLLNDAQDFSIMEDVHDVAHARPQRVDKHGRIVPGRFDTVLLNDGTGGLTGLQGYHVAQLRLVFKLPPAASTELFPDVIAPGYLAYVERFTPFTPPSRDHGLYKVSRQRDSAGARLATVVEVRSIRRSCHLFPITGAVIPREWTSSTVLDTCESFWLNSFSDLHMYMIAL